MEPKFENISKPGNFGEQNKLMDSMQASRANDSDCCGIP